VGRPREIEHHEKVLGVLGVLGVPGELRVLRVGVGIALSLLTGLVAAEDQRDEAYVTTSVETTLFSVNDGEAGALVSGLGSAVADSFTVISLSPDTPPVIKTTYGTTASTLIGSPHAAIAGRFGIVTNHNMRIDAQRNFVEIEDTEVGDSQLAVVDLKTGDVTATLQIEAKPWLAKTHIDDERVIVALSDGWLVIKISATGTIAKLTRSGVGHPITSFDLSSDGRSILAAVGAISGEQWLAQFVVQADDSVKLLANTDAGNFVVDAPFSPRIAPNGRTALVLNSGGLSDGVLDDVLVVDMASNTVTALIPQVSDGLESLAIHPSSTFAVIACLNAMPWSTTSHLAVISLAGEAPTLLSTMPVEPLPEGIEFSMDGEQLFVGSTLANQIAVYDVRGMKLIPSPFVLPVGEGHAALGISFDP